MNLWIRSQDKTLLEKAEMIKVVEDDNFIGIVVNNDYVFGEYKTKERAIEILDVIQRGISINFSLNGSYQEMDLQIKAKMVNGLYGAIYEMPID